MVGVCIVELPRSKSQNREASGIMTGLSDVYVGRREAAGGALSARACPFMELRRGNGLGSCAVG